MALSNNKFINFLVKYKKEIKHILLCIVGSFVLAFGTAVFLTPADVVAGGISGIGIIINRYVEPLIHFQIVDIVVWSLNVILFVISFIFLGKKFTIHTLIATFTFPAFLTLIMRTGMFNFIVDAYTAEMTEPQLATLMAGIFGGLFVGIGVALTFLGDGSTGGLDVLCFICYKYLHIKVSITSFAFDGIIILVSAFALEGHVIPAFVGVLSALISAIVIDIMYVRTNNACIIDIVTTHYKEINNYIIKVLDRTSTIMNAEGAFSKKKFKIVRFVVDKRSLPEVRDQIAKIDSKAFVTVSSANLVLGEGFLPIRVKEKKKAKKWKK